jgi:Gas vesicle synthesis protein GvpL/GvpF
VTGSRKSLTRRGRPVAAATPGQAATYVYCVVRSAGPPDLRGAPEGLPGTGKLRALAAGPALWLIVANAPVSRYGEAALARVVRDLDAVSRCAVAHSAVVARLARRHAVLPLRLLTLFSNDGRALAQVRRRRVAIARRLTTVAGRAEWGVQARLQAGGGPSARRARAVARRDTAGLSPGTRFLELRRRQRETARGLTGGARAAAASLHRALTQHADAARQRPLVSVDGSPALLLDAAYLVPATRTARFRQAVRAQAARAADHGLHVRLTGPWPPYSFVAGRL